LKNNLPPDTTSIFRDFKGDSNDKIVAHISFTMNEFIPGMYSLKTSLGNGLSLRTLDKIGRKESSIIFNLYNKFKIKAKKTFGNYASV
jgi:hypothetical protein